MKLKPFNLEEWLKNKNQNVWTKGGMKILNLTYFDKSTLPHALCGLNYFKNDYFIDTWNISGHKYNSDNPSDLDLMLEDK